MNKMTDNEIIKALENLTFGGHSCGKCKHQIKKGEERCGIEGCNIARNALDLINRLKAENERLTDHNKQLRYDRNQIKSEAYKEFAERVKQLPSVTNCEYEWTYLDIDNLLAELTPTTLNKLPHNSLCETETYEG